MFCLNLFINLNDIAEINIIQHNTSKTNTQKIRSDASALFPTQEKKMKKLFIDSFLMGPTAPSTTQWAHGEWLIGKIEGISSKQPPGQLNMLSSKAPQQKSN